MKIDPKTQLIASLGACLVLLLALIFLLVRVDKSDNLEPCDSVANKELRHIPARCLSYYMEQTPTPE